MLTEERIQYQDDFFPFVLRLVVILVQQVLLKMLEYHASRVSCLVPPRRAVYHKIELEPGVKPPTI